jgi:hypothetical protein
MKTFKKIFVSLITSLVFFAVFTPIEAAGTTLYFKTLTPAVAPGSVINVDVLIDSSSPVNALSLSMNYPSSMLESVGFDNSNSIINIWQEKPQSAAVGTITFSGGMFKGFSGIGGHLITLQFKVLKAGSAALSFGATKVYLADGSGTEASVITKKASVTGEAEAKVESAPVVPFTPTEADVVVEHELNSYSQARSIDTKLPIIIVGIFIVIIGGVVVYNKRKRKI